MSFATDVRTLRADNMAAGFSRLDPNTKDGSPSAATGEDASWSCQDSASVESANRTGLSRNQRRRTQNACISDE